MGDMEVLLNEGGSVNVLQDYSPRRLEGLERHRVLRWLKCNIFPLHFKVPNTTKFLESPDDAFNRFLKAFFLFTLSLGLLRIIIYHSSTFFVAAAIVVAVIMAVTMKQNTDFTTARTEEVKPTSGYIVQV